MAKKEPQPVTVRPKSREETPKEGSRTTPERHPALHKLMCAAQKARGKGVQRLRKIEAGQNTEVQTIELPSPESAIHETVAIRDARNTPAVAVPTRFGMSLRPPASGKPRHRRRKRQKPAMCLRNSAHGSADG
jgi:hypothetical protein